MDHEVVSCGACDRLLGPVEQIGRAGGGTKILTIWSCPRCRSEISVITKRYQPLFGENPHLDYRRP